MKNKRLELVFLAAALAFAAFTVGFFSGRASIKGSFTVETQHGESPSVAVVSEADGTDNAGAERAMPSETERLIDINTADAEELRELPGIGEVLAERIIRYREENGGFDSADDIKNVDGIGDGIYGGISDLITAGKE